MSRTANVTTWPFFRFGLIVTGKGERCFLRFLFRSLEATGHCTFKVIAFVGQRGPITSAKRIQRMVGTGKTIPDRDADEIGMPARRFLSVANAYVILIDDLEADRVPQAEAIFARYRAALDTMVGAERHRASVHFLVNMLEAYYFADARAINAVLGTKFVDHPNDAEEIRHPKNQLKQIFPGFDEIEHGRQILSQLDVEHVLSRHDTCASLRTLFGWCLKAIGIQPSETYQLANGSFFNVTRLQMDSLD